MLKKNFLVFFLAIVVVLEGLSVDKQWIIFKNRHKKIYSNIVEEQIRLQIFQDNLKIIEEHNARYDVELESYWMDATQFADMTSDEFSAMLKVQIKKKPTVKRNIYDKNLTAPNSIDWRQLGAVLEVKNQKNCGSSWAFSAIGAIEGQLAIHYKQTKPLSEQQLIDCSGFYGNGNCTQGGHMVSSFKFVKDNRIERESAYPYVGRQGLCRTRSGPITISNYAVVAKNENSLKNAVGTIGPISVCIYAEPIQLYGGGIFESSNCFNDEQYLNHAVLAVGYGTRPFDYWILKNSWGTDWGEEGYMKLARNVKQCGIGIDSSYPIL